MRAPAFPVGCVFRSSGFACRITACPTTELAPGSMPLMSELVKDGKRAPSFSCQRIELSVEEDETTASGIVLPDTAKEKPQKGKVLAVGDGKLDDDGKRIPLDVAEGDEVLYSKYGGTEIKVDGDDLLVLRESDVLAKVQ